MTTTPIPTAELERIIELGEKATSGPWEVDNTSAALLHVVHAGVEYSICDLGSVAALDWDADIIAVLKADAEIIALARNLAPALAAELIALRVALRSLRDEMAHEAPRDCWSTGPFTGDVIHDHLVCPGCVAIAAADRLLPSAGQETE